MTSLGTCQSVDTYKVNAWVTFVQLNDIFPRTSIPFYNLLSADWKLGR